MTEIAGLAFPTKWLLDWVFIEYHNSKMRRFEKASLSDHSVLRRHSRVIIKKENQHWVMVALESAQMTLLDSTAKFIWDSIDGKRTLSDIAELVCTKYKIPFEVAANDVKRAATSLKNQDLVF